MSFDLVQLGKLQAVGGKVLARYEALVAAADNSAYDSPAARELEAFQRDFVADPEAVISAVHGEAHP